MPPYFFLWTLDRHFFSYLYFRRCSVQPIELSIVNNTWWTLNTPLELLLKAWKKKKKRKKDWVVKPALWNNYPIIKSILIVWDSLSNKMGISLSLILIKVCKYNKKQRFQTTNAQWRTTIQKPMQEPLLKRWKDYTCQ
jgi:hypothetical protein